MNIWWSYARLAAAVLGAAAIIRQFSLAVGNAIAAETPWANHVPTVVANFFSYFTILSNLIAAVVLVIAAIWMIHTMRNTTPEPYWLAALLLSASTYMIVTGIVYNLLLRNIAIAGISDVWTNETLHVIIPLFMLADVLFAPRRRALPWSTMLTAAAFPIVWAAYTLIRANFIIGPAHGNHWWYPYPFLDPNIQGGYPRVIVYVIGIAAAMIGVAALVVWAGRRRIRSREATEPIIASREN